MDTPAIGRTILLDAAYKGRVDLFSYLLITGADLSLKDTQGNGLEEYISMDYSEVLTNNQKFVKTDMIKQQLLNQLHKYSMARKQNNFNFNQPVSGQFALMAE